MSTPEERKNFFNANKDACTKIIELEKTRRNKAQIDSLTGRQIDFAVGKMLDHVRAGVPFEKFIFPQTFPKELEEEPVEQVKVPEKINYNFTITKCENGFLLVESKHQYIFKNLKELTNIFGKLFFKGETCQIKLPLINQQTLNESPISKDSQANLSKCSSDFKQPLESKSKTKKTEALKQKSSPLQRETLSE